MPSHLSLVVRNSTTAAPTVPAGDLQLSPRILQIARYLQIALTVAPSTVAGIEQYLMYVLRKHGVM